jgi:ribosomal protein S18 acetylase RimI-like enzyme
MIVETKKRYTGKIIIVLASLALLFGSSYYFYSKPSIDIKDFDKKRDLPFIEDAFKRDMYLLVANPEFSLNFLLEHMSPNKDPEYFGKLNFKILFENDKPAGFTTYYKKKFYEGLIQFIYVNPNFRNKGYAKTLTKYAANSLFNMGVSVVRMATRIENIPAIKAYTKIGFKEVYRDDEFIDFEITKDELKKHL